jgi:hypothetical protein
MNRPITQSQLDALRTALSAAILRLHRVDFEPFGNKEVERQELTLMQAALNNAAHATAAPATHRSQLVEQLENALRVARDRIQSDSSYSAVTFGLHEAQMLVINTALAAARRASDAPVASCDPPELQVTQLVDSVIMARLAYVEQCAEEVERALKLLRRALRPVPRASETPD